MAVEDRVLDDYPRGGREEEYRADAGDERATASSSALARALRLVQRLGSMPVAATEIEAACERVRARVFAAIAAQHDGVCVPAATAELYAPDAARVEDIAAALALRSRSRGAARTETRGPL